MTFYDDANSFSQPTLNTETTAFSEANERSPRSQYAEHEPLMLDSEEDLLSDGEIGGRGHIDSPPKEVAPAKVLETPEPSLIVNCDVNDDQNQEDVYDTPHVNQSEIHDELHEPEMSQDETIEITNVTHDPSVSETNNNSQVKVQEKAADTITVQKEEPKAEEEEEEWNPSQEVEIYLSDASIDVNAALNTATTTTTTPSISRSWSIGATIPVESSPVNRNALKLHLTPTQSTTLTPFTSPFGASKQQQQHDLSSSVARDLRKSLQERAEKLKRSSEIPVTDQPSTAQDEDSHSAPSTILQTLKTQMKKKGEISEKTPEKTDNPPEETAVNDVIENEAMLSPPLSPSQHEDREERFQPTKRSKLARQPSNGFQLDFNDTEVPAGVEAVPIGVVVHERETSSGAKQFKSLKTSQKKPIVAVVGQTGNSAEELVEKGRQQLKTASKSIENPSISKKSSKPQEAEDSPDSLMEVENIDKGGDSWTKTARRRKGIEDDSDNDQKMSFKRNTSPVKKIVEKNKSSPVKTASLADLIRMKKTDAEKNKKKATPVVKQTKPAKVDNEDVEMADAPDEEEEVEEKSKKIRSIIKSPPKKNQKSPAKGTSVTWESEEQEHKSSKKTASTPSKRKIAEAEQSEEEDANSSEDEPVAKKKQQKAPVKINSPVKSVSKKITSPIKPPNKKKKVYIDESQDLAPEEEEESIPEEDSNEDDHMTLESEGSDDVEEESSEEDEEEEKENTPPRALRRSANTRAKSPDRTSEEEAELSDSTKKRAEKLRGSSEDVAERYSKAKEKTVLKKKTSKLFDGITFLVTGLNGNGDSSRCDDNNDIRSLPLEIESLIKYNSGNIVKEPRWRENSGIVRGYLRKVIPKTILISDIPRRTPKYLLALAAGVPCVHYRWIQKCAERQELLSYEKYLLPRGYSEIAEEDVTEYDEPFSTRIFDKDLRIEIVAKDSQFKMHHSYILHEAGAKVVERLFSGGQIDVVLCDKHPDKAFMERIKQLKVPVVNVHWVVECLVNNQKLDYDVLPKFKQFDKMKKKKH